MANGHEIANPVMVQIRVKGNLDHRWSDWFDGFAIEPRPNDETLLSGAVVDQAASYDILPSSTTCACRCCHFVDHR